GIVSRAVPPWPSSASSAIFGPAASGCRLAAFPTDLPPSRPKITPVTAPLAPDSLREAVQLQCNASLPGQSCLSSFSCITLPACPVSLGRRVPFCRFLLEGLPCWASSVVSGRGVVPGGVAGNGVEVAAGDVNGDARPGRHHQGARRRQDVP